MTASRMTASGMTANGMTASGMTVRARANRRRRLAYLAALGVATCGAPGLTACASKGERAGSVRTNALTVTRGDLQDTILMTGKLAAVRSENLVVPRTSSFRLSIRYMAEDGARVKKGDVVLEFDKADLSSRLEERKLEALEAENQLIRERANNLALKADKTFAVLDTEILLQKGVLSAQVPKSLLPEREHQDRQLLVKRTEVKLEKVKDELVAHEKGSALTVDIQRIALDKTRREIELVESELSSLSLTAPSDGILIVRDNPMEDRKFAVGDIAWPGLAVVELPDLSAMKVEAELSDVDDGRVSVGMPAVCVLDAFSERPIECRVEELSPVAQSESSESMRRAFAVELSLASTDAERMRPGMSVKVQIRARAAESAIIAPRAGLDVARRRAYLDGGDETDVDIDWCTAQACTIKSGLREGMRLRAGGGA